MSSFFCHTRVKQIEIPAGYRRLPHGQDLLISYGDLCYTNDSGTDDFPFVKIGDSWTRYVDHYIAVIRRMENQVKIEEVSVSWDKFFKNLETRREKGVDVLPYPHPSLRHVAVPVKTFDADLKKLVRVMFDLMYEQRGVGLAAPQIGMPLQVFVLNNTVSKKDDTAVEYDPAKELVFVNPKIEPKIKGRQPARLARDAEGCLSIPGLRREVERPLTVTFSARNENNEEFHGEYNGFLARIIQHENDHLNGKLFVDSLDDKQHLGVGDWLRYLIVQYEALIGFGTFKSSEEELQTLRDLETLA